MTKVVDLDAIFACEEPLTEGDMLAVFKRVLEADVIVAHDQAWVPVHPADGKSK